MKSSSTSTLQIFLRRLTNLRGNSRLLFLPRLHSEQLIDLSAFSFLKGETAFAIIEALIAGRSKVISQLADSRLEANNIISGQLKKLQRIDRFLQDERGSLDLHIGWPFVHGKFNDGTSVRCPLLFFPIGIEQVGSDWELRVRTDAGVTFNKSFLLAYAFYNQLKVDEELMDFSFEEWATDSTIFRTQLYQVLKDKIELNFNSELFIDVLKQFTQFRKVEFDEQHKLGELKLQPEAVLGIFPQTGSQLIPDYLTLISDEDKSDFDTFFEARNRTKDAQNLYEENILTPLDIDEWQEQAIRLVKLGKSLVVQGPPGTGKSQLIGNIICDAIASGKKVLVVCQKRAALDVVHDRLSKLGLSNFIGLVHDFRADRKQLYSTIAEQVDSIQHFKVKNRGIDVIQMERQFYQVSRSIDAIADELEEFRKALYNDTECGLSAKELYLTSSVNLPTINVKQEYSFFDFNSLTKFLPILKRYVRYALRFSNHENVWHQRVSFAHTNFEEVKKRSYTINSVVEFQKKFEDNTRQLLGNALTVWEGEDISSQIPEMQQILDLVTNETIYKYFVSIAQEKDDETSFLWLDNTRLLCMNCFTAEGLETTIPANQLTAFQQILEQRMLARKRSVFRWLRWELFSKDKFLIKRTLIANKLTYTRKGLQTLEARLDNRLNLEHHLTTLRRKKWLLELPNNYHQATLLHWFDNQKHAIRAKINFTGLREIRSCFNLQNIDCTNFRSTIQRLVDCVASIGKNRVGWENDLTQFQIKQILEIPTYHAQLVAALRNDYEDLATFDQLKQALSVNEKAVIEKLYDFSQKWDPQEMEKLLQNSLRVEWLNHLEVKYPVLRLISTQKFTEMEKELQNSVIEKQKLTKELVLIKARELAYEHIEYNRLNNAVTYRDLHHQVTKKKKVWPLRRLIEQHHHELFDLMPCWMASPETVSAIFPMAQLFDIVIFDEASQCFAERGIPAIARGKQVVIAGDSQQLQPSDLYQPRWNEESDEPDTEVDSLLTFIERYLPTIYLQGHYRSKGNELIDFSNQHFYKNRLKMLPDFEYANSKEPPIQVEKVSGVWDKQCNKVEALEVVSQVLVLMEKYPEKELGVITFNAPQQQLIYDLLEARLASEELQWPASLFVKNIENVQGDEKDIIIFSIAYAADRKGNLNLQFGSLSQSGGENRLNVAITRAREKIIIITSIQPEQLEVENVKNEGPRLLRKYLEYAQQISARQQVLPLYADKLANAPNWYFTSKLHSETTALSPLPFADMVVSKLKKFEALVLTDDELYRSSLSAKAAHAYLPILLEKKNWNFVRLFSRNYWIDKDKVLLNIRKLTG